MYRFGYAEGRHFVRPIQTLDSVIYTSKLMVYHTKPYYLSSENCNLLIRSVGASRGDALLLRSA